LHVKGKARFEAVFPVDLEAKELHVELLRLGLVEDAKNWRRLCQAQMPTSVMHHGLALTRGATKSDESYNGGWCDGARPTGCARRRWTMLFPDGKPTLQ